MPMSSDGMDVSLCGTDRSWLVHALSLSAGGFLSSGVTECTKLFLDFMRLQARDCIGNTWSHQVMENLDMSQQITYMRYMQQGTAEEVGLL